MARSLVVDSASKDLPMLSKITSRIAQTFAIVAVLGAGVSISACSNSGTGGTASPLSKSEKAALDAARTLVIIKQLVTQAHLTSWSAPLLERARQCDKPTRDETLACLEPFTPENNDKVVAALEAYAAAATLAGQTILASSDSEASLKDSVTAVTGAALGVVKLIPGTSGAVTAIELIVGSI